MRSTEDVVADRGDGHRIAVGVVGGRGDHEAVERGRPAFQHRRRAGFLHRDLGRDVLGHRGVVVVVAGLGVLVVDADHRDHIGQAFAGVEVDLALDVEAEALARLQHDRRAAIGRQRRRQQVAEDVVADRGDGHRIAAGVVGGRGDHEAVERGRPAFQHRRRAGFLHRDLGGLVREGDAVIVAVVVGHAFVVGADHRDHIAMGLAGVAGDVAGDFEAEALALREHHRAAIAGGEPGRLGLAEQIAEPVVAERGQGERIDIGIVARAVIGHRDVVGRGRHALGDAGRASLVDADHRIDGGRQDVGRLVVGVVVGVRIVGDRGHGHGVDQILGGLGWGALVDRDGQRELDRVLRARHDRAEIPLNGTVRDVVGGIGVDEAAVGGGDKGDVGIKNVVDHDVVGDRRAVVLHGDGVVQRVADAHRIGIVGLGDREIGIGGEELLDAQERHVLATG